MSRLISAGARYLKHRLFHMNVCDSSLISVNGKCVLSCLRTFPFYKHPLSSLSTLCSLMDEKNIVLLGAPGAGKTTVGVILGQLTGLPMIDIAELLENTWHMSVTQKLQEIGDELFLQEEGEILKRFSITRSIIALTGSNPMHPQSMYHIKKNGIVVYLDVPLKDLLERLEGMKIDHIVGLRPGVPMQEILQSRQQFYHMWYDIRVLCQFGDSAETVAEKVLDGLKRHQGSEMFISTRSTAKSPELMKDPSSFTDVLIEGLALDGGLYVPADSLPEMTVGEWQRLVEAPYTERAQVLLERSVHPDDVPAVKLREMVKRAYGQNFACNRIAPIRHLTDNQFLLELFHGPTASFKDFALQLLPQLFAYCMPRTCSYLILMTTSGDTGSAVLDGISCLSDNDKQRISVLIFFPEEGISQIQKEQMISYEGKNVKTVGVKSNFDFCQTAIKQIFTNPDYTGFLTVEYGSALSTANSINWACLLLQVIYHASAYLDLIKQGIITFGDPVDVCIPTGNFGNILAAVYAKCMGIPIRKFICASNQNNALTDFIRTGKYDLRYRIVTASLSPGLDVLRSSNVERYLHLVAHGDGQLVRELFSQLDESKHFQVPNTLLKRIQHNFVSDWCSEKECLAAIYSVHKSTGYILDPHTAVAKVVADRQQDWSCPVIISSTAHPCKFTAGVLQALRVKEISQHPSDQLQMLNSLNSLPSVHKAVLERIGKSQAQKKEACPADPSAIMDTIENFIQQKFMRVV
ncbi:threonine synthase-like 1 [Pristis pectinata]|uniref:threonine synthase-like 1 n=1 Tax=Pristis pectinata TaxID=685728 RepID=UPI00223D4800|nr:threonine synthase-like 1 [Pristis pectinata]